MIRLYCFKHMKIKELQISNILSFKHFDDIDQTPRLTFDGRLNILIGENGSGKSTALEVLNFVFKRVLFVQYNLNQDSLLKKDELSIQDQKQIFSPVNNNTYTPFRLEPNWDFEDKPQKIRLSLELDDIDEENIKLLIEKQDNLRSVASKYSQVSINLQNKFNKSFVIDIIIAQDKTYSTVVSPDSSDSGYQYLVNYNYFKGLIELHNSENPTTQLPSLFESFTLIGGYRNYSSFSPAISLSSSTAISQIQKLRESEYKKSTNSTEAAEPTVFNLVRLRIAEVHYNLFGDEKLREESEDAANNQEFLQKINASLRLVNLEAKVHFHGKQRWEYTFEFYDLKRNKPLADIQSLSAGQKAIIHLIFEAYGRGDLKGGLVIIDEPEIHLHYQFQNEYLRVIEQLNREQLCQYVLVTHSESLINSSTIYKIKRFALDEDNYTVIKSPVITEDQKLLIRILDNTRSTFAFFAKKVLLVEGQSDRYFYKALIQKLNPDLEQQVAVLDIIGKREYPKWKEFFESFGLSVYFACDLDAAFGLLYPDETVYKLDSEGAINGFKCTHKNIDSEIESRYQDKIFILKDGDLETYLGIQKDKESYQKIIDLCNRNLDTVVASSNNPRVEEIKKIISELAQ